MAGVIKPFGQASRTEKLVAATKRGRKAAANRVHNVTSKPGTNYETGDQFGRKSAEEVRVNRTGRRFSALAGGTIGLVGGAVAGTTMHSPQSKKDQRVINQYQRARRQDYVSKARTNLITDMATGARKTKRLPYFKPVAFGTAAAGAGALTYAPEKMVRTDTRRRLERAYKKQGVQKRAGLESYTISPRERRKERVKSSAHSTVAAPAIFEAYRHVGNQIARKTGVPKTKMNPKLLGGVAIAGGVLGAAGKYDKKQYRVVQKSAFGVEHGS